MSLNGKSPDDWWEDMLNGRTVGREFLREGDYVNAAVAFVAAAQFNRDARRRELGQQAASVLATLALRDMVEELTAEVRMLRRIVGANVDKLREVA